MALGAYSLAAYTRVLKLEKNVSFPIWCNDDISSDFHVMDLRHKQAKRFERERDREKNGKAAVEPRYDDEKRKMAKVNPTH